MNLLLYMPLQNIDMGEKFLELSIFLIDENNNSLVSPSVSVAVSSEWFRRILEFVSGNKKSVNFKEEFEAGNI